MWTRDHLSCREEVVDRNESSTRSSRELIDLKGMTIRG